MASSIPSLRRISPRLAGAVLLLLTLGWLTCAWLAARHVARPGSFPLQDHHRAILSDPAAHGISIQPFTLSDGSPVLICRPDPKGALDERGTKLRSQLLEKNLPLPPAGIENNASLVLLHGRHGRKEDNLAVAVRFCSAGFRCLLPDLPGHGDHPVKVAHYGLSESALPRQVLLETSRHLGFPARPAGLWGMSMGGSVAVHAAAAAPSDWDAIVIVASFDELSPVVRNQCFQMLGRTIGAAFFATLKPFFALETGFPLSDIRPVQQAGKVQAPALIAHGDDDPLIPLPAARRLFDALGSSRKQWVDVGSGTHGNVLITAHPLYAEMTRWFLTEMLP